MPNFGQKKSLNRCKNNKIYKLALTINFWYSSIKFENTNRQALSFLQTYINDRLSRNCYQEKVRTTRKVTCNQKQEHSV